MSIAATEDWLRLQLRRNPEALALRGEDGDLSYAALDAAVGRAAGWLRAQGAESGGRVAAFVRAPLPFAVLVHACLRLSCALAPLNTRLTAAELAWQLEDVRPSLFVHDESPEALAAAASARVPQAALPRQGLPEGPPLAPKASYPLAEVAAIVYTSGTTGRPKGAMLTRGNFFYSALASAHNLGHLPSDRWLAALPLFHVGGLSILLRAALFGAAVVLMPGFDAAAVDRALEEQAITLTSLVAVMLRRLLAVHGERPFPPRLRAVLVGGGPVPDDLLARALAAGLPVLPTYGLTETAAQAATWPLGRALVPPRAAALPLLGTELRVVDDQGRDVPAGVAGEILVRGPSVFVGYFGKAAQTALALRGGWLHTGDVGVLDAEGFLSVLDRRADLIVSGGENVYPAEVEQALGSHPAVAEAGCFALPDPEWGQSVHALVVLRPGATLTAEDLLRHAATRLARYKVPRTIRFVRSLPRTASGKLQRHRLATWEDPAC